MPFDSFPPPHGRLSLSVGRLRLTACLAVGLASLVWCSAAVPVARAQPEPVVEEAGEAGEADGATEAKANDATTAGESQSNGSEPAQKSSSGSIMFDPAGPEPEIHLLNKPSFGIAYAPGKARHGEPTEDVRLLGYSDSHLFVEFKDNTQEPVPWDDLVEVKSLDEGWIFDLSAKQYLDWKRLLSGSRGIKYGLLSHEAVVEQRIKAGLMDDPNPPPPVEKPAPPPLVQQPPPTKPAPTPAAAPPPAAAPAPPMNWTLIGGIAAAVIVLLVLLKR